VWTVQDLNLRLRLMRLRFAVGLPTFSWLALQCVTTTLISPSKLPAQFKNVIKAQNPRENGTDIPNSYGFVKILLHFVGSVFQYVD